MLAACQTGPVDSGGVGVQVSEWKTIDVAEVDLNFPLLITATVTKAEYQNRDNRINHYRLVLNGGKGRIHTQRFPDAWYSDTTQVDYGDIEYFKGEVTNFLKDDFVAFEEIQPVRHRTNKSIGFVAVVDVKDPAKDKCLMGKVAFRLKPRKGYSNDEGNVDTLVRLSYCDAVGNIPDFSRALENVDVVTDKAAFAAALAAK